MGLEVTKVTDVPKRDNLCGWFNTLENTDLWCFEEKLITRPFCNLWTSGCFIKFLFTGKPADFFFPILSPFSIKVFYNPKPRPYLWTDNIERESATSSTASCFLASLPPAFLPLPSWPGNFLKLGGYLGLMPNAAGLSQFDVGFKAFQISMSWEACFITSRFPLILCEFACGSIH